MVLLILLGFYRDLLLSVEGGVRDGLGEDFVVLFFGFALIDGLSLLLAFYDIGHSFLFASDGLELLLGKLKEILGSTVESQWNSA